MQPEPYSPDDTTHPARTSRLSALLAFLYFAGLAAGVLVLIRGSRETRSAEPVKKSILTLQPADTAVISIYGPIRISGDSGPFDFRGADRTVRELRRVRSMPGIKAVVLRINSPGGSVAATQEIYDEVMQLRKAGKKVVASFGDVAASGGYYVASAADKIVANPGTITGSIGVILQVGNTEELFRKIGLKVEIVKSGAHKDMGSPTRPLTPQERALLQSLVSDAYGQFTDAIVKGRGMEKAKVLALADGRIFTGAQAQEVGLVDALGNREEALTLARKLAGLEGEPKILDERPGFERFFEIFSQGSESARFWPSPASLASAWPQRLRFEYMWE